MFGSNYILHFRGRIVFLFLECCTSDCNLSSSHSKGETVILSKEPLGENALRAAINATGYMAGEISTAVYEKKGFFHFGKKKQ